MYDLKIKSTFIHYRAQGLTINRISEVMGINRTTLIQWNKELYADIKIAERDEYDKIFEAAYCDKITRVTTLALELGASYDKLAMKDDRTDKLTLLKDIEKLTKLLQIETEDKKYSSLVQKASVKVNKEFPVIINDKKRFKKFDDMYKYEDEFEFDWNDDISQPEIKEEDTPLQNTDESEFETDNELTPEEIRKEEEKELKQNSDENCIVTNKADTKRAKRILNLKPDMQVLKSKKERRSFKKIES